MTETEEILTLIEKLSEEQKQKLLKKMKATLNLYEATADTSACPQQKAD